MKPICLALLIALCVVLPVASQTTQAPAKPTKVPVAPTAAQLESLRSAVKLHDQAKFDEAIAIYEAVLKQNPDCVIALYEIASSLQSKHDYAKSIEFATRGTEYDSSELSSFYMLIASAYDDQGDPAKAVETFKHALAIKPSALLYFNLGITLGRQKNDDEAKANFKQSAFHNPNHPSTHLELGKVFMRNGMKAQGLLALSRFLILEPTSPRTGEAYQLWFRMIQESAVRGENNTISVPVTWSGDKSEGDFAPQYLQLGLSRTMALTMPQGPPEVQYLVKTLEGWFRSFGGETPADRSAFTWTYYAPFFVEMQKLGYTEPFVYWISQRTDLPGVREWISDAANRQRGNEFIQWAQRYAWPKPPQ